MGSGNKPHVANKHDIRKQIHKQLAELWNTHPTLKNMNSYVRPVKIPGSVPGSVNVNIVIARGEEGDEGKTFVETMAAQFNRCGYGFVPLVSEKLNFVCSLDILFLRRENPGELIKQGGDIDNRIKTLFDALRIPKDCNEIVGLPDPDETPFFCLMEDDSLVTELNVTTDRLFTPLKTARHKHEVMLIIKVKIKATQVSFGNLSLL